MLVNKAAPVPSMSRCIIYPYFLTLCASTRITWPPSSRSLTCRGAGAGPTPCPAGAGLPAISQDISKTGTAAAAEDAGPGVTLDLWLLPASGEDLAEVTDCALCSRRRRQLERSSWSAAKNRNLSWDGAAGGRWCPRTDWRMDGSGRSGIMEAPKRSARVITRMGGSPWAYFLKRLLSRRTL